MNEIIEIEETNVNENTLEIDNNGSESPIIVFEIFSASDKNTGAQDIDLCRYSVLIELRLNLT